MFILNTGKDPKELINLNHQLYTNKTYENNIKTDCNNTIRYCTSDYDCSIFCKPSASFNIKNICNNITKTCTPTPLIPNTNCDIKKGFLDSYVQTELDGFWKCLNTKPYFFDEQQQLYGYVCGSGGSVEYDFNKNVQLSCKCPIGYIQVFNINKPNIPICVQKEKLKILSSFIELPKTKLHP